MEITAVSGSGPRSPHGSNGVSFSVTVVESAGSQRWVIRVGSELIVVTSRLNLVPGQTLKVFRSTEQPHQWLVEPDTSRPGDRASRSAGSLVGQPLAAVEHRLDAWTRWFASTSSVLDRNDWAAMAAAQSLPPTNEIQLALSDWLSWLTKLESGTADPPPTDEEVWDQWNLRRARGGAQWLAMPLHWTYGERRDSGFLQARWNDSLRRIDRWVVTACPDNHPVRIDADVSPESLTVHLWFFKASDAHAFDPTMKWLEKSFENYSPTVRFRNSLRPLIESPSGTGRVNVEI